MSDTTFTFDTKKVDIILIFFFFKYNTLFWYCSYPDMSPGSFYLIFIDDYRFYNRFYCNNIFLVINVAPKLSIYRSFVNFKFLFWHSTSKGKSWIRKNLYFYNFILATFVKVEKTHTRMAQEIRNEHNLVRQYYFVWLIVRQLLMSTG